MVQASGRFSGGGGGGSHRDVVFNLKVQADGKNDQVFGAMRKEIDALQRQMNSLRGGAGGVGGGGAGGRGGIRGSGRAGAGMSDLDRDFAKLERDIDNFDRQMNQRERDRERAARQMKRDAAELKRNWKDVADGVIGVSRAFVLFGVSSEENLEKAVRALAKFEGAVAGLKGAQKLAGGLGGLLGVSAPAAAAGLAVVAGGAIIGKGLHEQVTGQEGAVARSTRDIYAWLYRSRASLGLSTESGMLDSSRVGWHDRPYAGLAGSQLRFQRNFMETAKGRGEDLWANQYHLLQAQRQLPDIMEMMRMRPALDALGRDASDERERAALSFFSLDRRERQRALRARDRFQDDPTQVTEAELAMAVPLVDREGQARARSEYVRRAQSAGLYQRGFDDNLARGLYAATGKALIDIKLPTQREVVLKLQEQNEELLAQWETIMSRALEEAEKHNLEELQKIADRLMQQQKQIQTDQIQRLRAQETAMGGNP